MDVPGNGWARGFGGLQAFRPLVEAVAMLHKADIIHRDIKTKNIFVAKDNRLVLGHFGIVFYRDGQRLTETYERVGARDWMAPWGLPEREVSPRRSYPPLDIFPLAKVLWSMISGIMASLFGRLIVTRIIWRRCFLLIR